MFRTESFYEQVKAFECQIIRTALANAEGNQALAARRLGLAPTTLSSQLRRLGIDAKAYKLFTKGSEVVSWATFSTGRRGEQESSRNDGSFANLK
jgi:hypothetical protein